MVLVATSKPGLLGQDDNKQKQSSSQVKMTPEILLEICKERKMWELPHLNVQLYLNHKGFCNIGGLEDYHAVRTLQLGNNMIAKIEGLDRMLGLKCLNLEGNRISAIENLESNLELRQLNLESNTISSVSGISHLKNLENISLAHNNISRIEDLKELQACPKLSNIDVSHNALDETDGVVEFWSGFADCLRLLRYTSNPGIRFIEHYRKRLVNALPLLGYLDERPVFPVERRSCKAWAEGGNEAMQQAKKDFWKERNSFQAYEPERGELLSRMRKNAIARLDREEAEREAELQRRLAEGGQSTSDLQAGDDSALADYAQKWQKRVNLHGLDGLRAQVAKEDGSNAGVVAGAAAPARAKPQFAPPPRGSATDVAKEYDRHVSARIAQATPELGAASRQRQATKAQHAADFRVQASSTDEDDRQLQAFDGDIGHLSVIGGESGSPVNRDNFGSNGVKKDATEEVMPLIWQQNQAQNADAERQCVEQNLKACHQDSSTGNELSCLD